MIQMATMAMIAKNIKDTVVTLVFGMTNSELPVEKRAARA